MRFAGTRWTRFGALAAGITLAVVMCGSTIAGATWPGGNGSIAFDKDGDDGYLTFRMTKDGRDVVQVSELGKSTGEPSWSADGRMLVLDSDTSGVFQVYVTSARGTNTRSITNDGNCAVYPSWAPNGKKVVFVHYPDPQCNGDPDIWTVGRDGSNPRPLTTTPGERELLPYYSPDGSRIMFVTHTSAEHTFSISTMRPDGTGRKRITRMSLNATYPDWSPDGRRIVFVSGADEPQATLYTMNRDGSHPKRLKRTTPDVFITSPRWSPDGKTILYSSNAAGDQFDLYTLRLRDGHVVRLTKTAESELSSSWQPKSR